MALRSDKIMICMLSHYNEKCGLKMKLFIIMIWFRSIYVVKSDARFDSINTFEELIRDLIWIPLR